MSKQKRVFQSLTNLYIHDLLDVYDAERQLVQALPKMADAAHSPKLKKAFEDHQRETEGQINRLEEIFASMALDEKGVSCDGMRGIIKESEDLAKKPGNPDVIDAALIGSAQRAEHYEIAAYGTLRTYAQQLGQRKAYELLSDTLDEESNADERLTELAQSGINVEATGAA